MPFTLFLRLYREVNCIISYALLNKVYCGGVARLRKRCLGGCFQCYHWESSRISWSVTQLEFPVSDEERYKSAILTPGISIEKLDDYFLFGFCKSTALKTFEAVETSYEGLSLNDAYSIFMRFTLLCQLLSPLVNLMIVALKQMISSIVIKKVGFIG